MAVIANVKAHSQQASLRPSPSVDARQRSTSVDARLRQYGTHVKRPARSHQARLRPSFTSVDGRRRASTSVDAVLSIHGNGQIKHVDGHRRAWCEWAFRKYIALHDIEQCDHSSGNELEN